MEPQKTRKQILTPAVALSLSLSATNLSGQSLGNSWQPVEITEGHTLIANPLETGANRVWELFTDVPDGFELIKLSDKVWRTNRYSADSGEWSIPEMTLTPGEGALASSPEALIWNSIGKPITGILENFIPQGESLRASILPLAGRISTDLGFPAVEGLTLSTLDLTGNLSVSATYQDGSWQPEEPVLEIGKSVLVNSPTNIVWSKNFTVEGENNPLQITEQPQSATLNEGENLSLSVAASGADSLNYQWQHNGNDIESANQAIYSIAETTTNHTGSYSVVIFTSKHSIRSQQALVKITTPKPKPPITPAELTLTTRLSADRANLEITIAGEPGQAVRIEVAPAIPAETWEIKVENLVIGEDGTALHTEPIEGAALFVRAIPSSSVTPLPDDPPTPPAPAELTLTTRLSADDANLEIIIAGEPGQAVRIEVAPVITAETWEIKVENLVIGEDGTALHTEPIEGAALFVRAIPL